MAGRYKKIIEDSSTLQFSKSTLARINRHLFMFGSSYDLLGLKILLFWECLK